MGSIWKTIVKKILYETYILTNNLCQNYISLVESDTCVELYTNWLSFVQCNDYVWKMKI